MATILTMAFAFGSAVYAFTNKYLLIAVVILFYFFIQKLLHWHRRQKYTSQTEIHQAGQIYKLRSLMDSGNALIDPITRAPVTMISLPVFLKIFPEISADKILLQELDQCIPGGHYITCRTVNGAGQVFVFKPERMVVNGNHVKNSLLGVAAQDYGNSKYEALLNVKLGGLL